MNLLLLLLRLSKDFSSRNKVNWSRSQISIIWQILEIKKIASALIRISEARKATVRENWNLKAKFYADLTRKLKIIWKPNSMQRNWNLKDKLSASTGKLKSERKERLCTYKNVLSKRRLLNETRRWYHSILFKNQTGTLFFLLI